MNRAWDLLGEQVGGGAFLLTEQYSIIDPYLLKLAYWHHSLARCPKLKRLRNTVQHRPAVQRIRSQHFPAE